MSSTSDFQKLSFIASIIINSIVMFLISTKSPKKIGSYKYIMLYFTMFAILFATIDVVVQPVTFTNGTTLLVASFTPPKSKWLMTKTIGMLCGCIGVVISFLAVHFIYRYFALERKGRLSYFKGKRVAIWLCIPFICGVLWGVVSYYCFKPDSFSNKYISKNVLPEYNVSLEKVAYLAVVYYDENGRFSKFHWVGFIVQMTMMTISLCIVGYFAIRSSLLIRKLAHSTGHSRFTKKLQRQLYKALIAQTLIPLLFMYIPVGTFMIFPIFNIDMKIMNKYVSYTYALYPCIDPIPLICIVDNYRIAILKAFIYIPKCIWKTLRTHRHNRVDIDSTPTTLSFGMSILCSH